MPYSASKPCPVSKCPNMRPCPKHPKDRYREKPKYYKWYYTSEWRVLRSNQLRKEPYCGECKKHNQHTIATEVDHVEEHKGDPKLFFSQRNLQSLCKTDHSRKTMRELNK